MVLEPCPPARVRSLQTRSQCVPVLSKARQEHGLAEVACLDIPCEGAAEHVDMHWLPDFLYFGSTKLPCCNML